MKSNVLIGILLLVFVANATIMPPLPGQRKPIVEKPLKVNYGPVDQNVFERKLLSERPTVKEIITEGKAYFYNTSVRMFDGPTLGFVTPWNYHGQELAATFAPKFDIISPVWLQIVYHNSNFEIAGKEDIDDIWMGEYKEGRNGGLRKLHRYYILFELI